MPGGRSAARHGGLRRVQRRRRPQHRHQPRPDEGHRDHDGRRLGHTLTISGVVDAAGSNLYIAAGWRNENDPKGLVVVNLTGEKTTVPASTAAARSARRPDPMSPEALEQLTIQQGSSSQK